MTFDERTKCKALIETILQRQLNKPVVYHPTIMQEFNEEERRVIFGGPYVLEDYIQEIEAVLRFVEHDSITSPRVIMSACKMMIPREISGFYDCKLQIELWINIASDEFLIESYSERRELTKEEFLDLYRRAILSNRHTKLLTTHVHENKVPFHFYHSSIVLES